MGREKTGEDLLGSINEHTSVDQFELLFSQLSNHVSWFKAEQNLDDAGLSKLIASIRKAIEIKIQELPNAVEVKRRFEDALEKARKAGGPSMIN
jgi:hypothetical protein